MIGVIVGITDPSVLGQQGRMRAVGIGGRRANDGRTDVTDISNCADRGCFVEPDTGDCGCVVDFAELMGLCAGDYECHVIFVDAVPYFSW